MDKQYIIGMSGWSYGEWKGSFYPEEEIKTAFKQMASLSAAKIYAYFNNTIGAQGVENARQLSNLAAL
jgi:uncharacterized protein YecE (DUF72 family)